MAASSAASSWQTQLTQELEEVDRAFSGELSVYVKDIESGGEATLRADSHWYLASTIKVPVAIVLYSQIADGRLTFDTKVTLEYSDYVDGAGDTNWAEAGTTFTLRHLHKKMLIESDNTATDMVIRTLGLAAINEYLAKLQLNYLRPVTTLADVRRLAYSEFNDGALKFASPEFFSIRESSDAEGRVDILAGLFGVPRSALKQPDMNSAFDAYYAKDHNSGTMRGMGQLLERLVAGELLPKEQTAALLDIMESITTGGTRLKAVLPADVRFAHKTGTQHRRACDVGIAWAQPERKRPVIIAICTRGPLNTAESEAAIRAVGSAITRSGVFDLESLGVKRPNCSLTQSQPHYSVIKTGLCQALDATGH